MTRFGALLVALAITALPMGEAAAQTRGDFRAQGDSSRERERSRDDDRRSPSVGNAPRMELGDIVRRVSAGRQGRMLGVSPSGFGYVVRWEYPGGRVADIMVDRNGRVMGER